MTLAAETLVSTIERLLSEGTVGADGFEEQVYAVKSLAADICRSEGEELCRLWFGWSPPVEVSWIVPVLLKLRLPDTRPLPELLVRALRLHDIDASRQLVDLTLHELSGRAVERARAAAQLANHLILSQEGWDQRWVDLGVELGWLLEALELPEPAAHLHGVALSHLAHGAPVGPKSRRVVWHLFGEAPDLVFEPLLVETSDRARRAILGRLKDLLLKMPAPPAAELEHVHTALALLNLGQADIDQALVEFAAATGPAARLGLTAIHVLRGELEAGRPILLEMLNIPSPPVPGGRAVQAWARVIRSLPDARQRLTCLEWAASTAARAFGETDVRALLLGEALQAELSCSDRTQSEKLAAKLRSLWDQQPLAEQVAFWLRRCPRCGSKDVGDIVYGLLKQTPELTERIDRGEVALGGCELGSDRLFCSRCRHCW